MGIECGSEERKQGGPASTQEEDNFDNHLSCFTRTMTCQTCERQEVDPEHVELAEEGLDLEQQEIVENKKAKLEAKLTEAGSNIRTTFRLLDADRYFHTRCSALISPSLTTCRIASIYSNHSPMVQTLVPGGLVQRIWRVQPPSRVIR